MVETVGIEETGHIKTTSSNIYGNITLGIHQDYIKIYSKKPEMDNAERAIMNSETENGQKRQYHCLAFRKAQ